MSEFDVTCCDPAAEVSEERHHPYGPSRWPALAVCPHYAGKPGGADAQKGVALHALFAKAAKGELAEDAEENAADTFERNAIILGRKVLEMAGGNPEKMMVEETVVCPEPPGVIDHFDDGQIYGRKDVSWFDTATGDLHVADLKMVESPDRDYRPQLVPYAYGTAREWDATPTCHLHTLYVDTLAIKSDTMDWDELVKAYTVLRAKVYAASRPQEVAAMPVQSGWCQLCANFEACPAPRAVAETVAGGSLADCTKPTAWAALSPQRKAQICVLADTVIRWGKEVKAIAAKDAKSGVAIEDPDNGIYYGLQRKKGKLEPNIDLCWEAAKDLDIPREVFVTCLNVDQTRFKDLLMSKWMKSKEADAVLERCGARGNPTASFVRKGVK